MSLGARIFGGTVAFKGSAARDGTSTAVVSGADTYTMQLHMRLRGRQMNLKVESDTTGVKWRLGAPRLDMRPDGRR